MPDCPFARQVQIRARSQQPPNCRKTQVILHTMVATTRSVLDAWQRTNELESTFIISLSGELIQCMDSASRADANRNANSSAISIETEDCGPGRAADWNPDRVWVPWTVPQLEMIARVLEWCHRAHDIPMQRCASPTAAGVGYHTMWGAPSPWTPVAKTCPGVARIRQFDESIQPFLEGRPMRDNPRNQGWTQRPLRDLPAEVVRQRLIVDPSFPGRPTSRRSARSPVAGARR